MILIKGLAACALFICLDAAAERAEVLHSRAVELPQAIGPILLSCNSAVQPQSRGRAYEVTYLYQDRSFTTLLGYAPGDHIELDNTGRPRTQRFDNGN